MKAPQDETVQAENFPWVVFRLGTNQYAINSQWVSSIVQLTGEVTTMPDTAADVRGLISLRGSTIPLFDLRTIFGKVTLMGEYQIFADMLEQRKQDHLRWAGELKRSIINKSEFTLTTNPHQCAFGQWYDHYHDDRPSVTFQLKKIDEPHKRLHHAADLAREAALLTDAAQREETLRQVIDEVENEDTPQIVSLLDETANLLRNSIHELVLVLSNEDRSIGYIVDEVIAVQELERIGEPESLNGLSGMQYVVGIAKNEQGLILELDENILVQKANLHAEQLT